MTPLLLVYAVHLRHPRCWDVASTYGEKIVLNSARRYGRSGGNPPPAGYNPIPSYGRHSEDGQDGDPRRRPGPPPRDSYDDDSYREGEDDRLQPLYDDQGYGPYDDAPAGQPAGYDPATGPMPAYGQPQGYEPAPRYPQRDSGYALPPAAPAYDDRNSYAPPGPAPAPGYDDSYGAPAYDDGYGRGGRYAPDADEARYGNRAPGAPDGLYLPPPAPGTVPGPPPGYAPDSLGAPELSYSDEDDEPEAPRGRRRLRPPATPRPKRPRQPEPDDDGPQLPFVPGFAGLRAIALLAVLGWAAGLDAVRGGYLGISSVFTLSGFLVATLALAEWSQHSTLFLARFWERRARRIIPPYMVVLGIVVALQVVLRVGSVPTFRGDLLASLGFATNWRLAFPAEGFARSFTELSAVRQLWPVAITVQILVLLPPVFMLFMIVTGRRWRAAGGLFALLAAGSFGAAWVISDRAGGHDLTYYGTHTRAGEMLVGVVLAYLVLTPVFRKVLTHRRVMPVVRRGALGALAGLVLLWLAVPIDHERLFHGVTIVNAVLTAWVVLAVTLPGPANSVLGVGPLRYLGQISYATYLIFWPVYLLVDEDRTGQDGIVLAGARIGAAIAAGALLYWFVEVPLRKVRLSRSSFGVGLLGCGAAIAVVAMVLPVNPPANISLSVDDGNGPGDLDVVTPQGGGDDATDVLLMGDQTAESLVSGFEAWNGENTDEQMRVHTHVTPDCPLGGPGDVERLGATVESSVECEAWRLRLPRMLDAAEYDAVVVLMGVADLGERQIDNQQRHLGDPTHDRWMAEQIDGLADVLGEQDVPVLWVTQPHVRLASDDDSSDWTQFQDNDPYRVDRLNELIASVIREREGFELVDLGSWLYDQPRGEFNTTLRDGPTFTEEGATEVVTWLTPQLVTATSS